MATAYFNMVSVSNIQYADATADGTAPASLKSLNVVEEGKFNPDFPEPSTTPSINELTQQPYRIRRAPVTNKISVDLPQVGMDSLKDFMSGTFTAGAAGTTPDTFALSGSDSDPVNKYVLITGLNNRGKVVTCICHNCLVTSSWTGAVGANQTTVPLQVVFTLLEDNSADRKLVTFGGAF